ncbi:MAG TPA: choice-of-anchor V domain-containing protein [Bacteroidia bacterium]|nr:choice-of-anchor V domain-containing protein [Bacteroidia bacterium]
MNKKMLYSAIALLPIFIMAKMPESLSFGAPVSSTGAPDEATCTKSGCHDDNPLNKGNATLNVKIGDNITKYIPGKTYPITIRIAENGVNRFGFQAVALKDNDHLNAGTMLITDEARTQIVSNEITLQDRMYVTYTYPGTDPLVPGVGEWTMNWTAPQQNAGPVTLYVASVSANDDHSDKGDHVYTTSLTLSPDDQTSVKENDGELPATVCINGISKEVRISMQLQNEKRVKCALYNMEGRMVKILFDEKITSIDKAFELDVAAGIYIVRMTSENKEKNTKISIQ